MNYSIMHIIYSGAIGGGPVLVENLATGLELRGFDNLVISDNDGPLLNTLKNLHIHTKSMPLSTKWGFFYSIPSLIKFIKSFKPNVIILYGQFAGTFGGIAARLAGYENILYSAQFPSFSTDFNTIKKIRNYIAEKISCWCASKIVCISTANKMEYIRRNLTNPAKITLIYNGVKNSKIEQKEIRDTLDIPKGKLIGFVGRLSDQKGVSILIDAVLPILLQNKDNHLIIVGDGPLRNELSELVSKEGLPLQVHFLGFRSDIITIMKKFTILVVPSLFEPFGIVAIEGMMAGVPVIASRVDGLMDTISDGINGIHFTPGNKFELREKINYLLCNPKICSNLIEMGKIIAHEKFTVEIMVEKYAIEIKKMLLKFKHSTII